MDVAAPVIHSLKYIKTGSFQIPNFPEYMAVGYVDGVQISHYDSESGKAKAKQEWMNKITAEEPRYWETQTQLNIANQERDKVSIRNLQERFNQTGGLHMVQRMSGCQWDNETGQVHGWTHYAYDGEDFIWFDWKGPRWIAVQLRAVITKHKWDKEDNYNEFLKYYLTVDCPFYLKKYVSFGRDVLMRTELPRVSLLQKTAGSPVTCHATGFYPRAAVLFWRKDGKRLDKNVEVTEILPNHDGTFQTSARLITVDERARYECVFQLDGVPEEVITPLDLAEVLSNECIEAQARRETVLAVAGPLALIFLAVAICVIVVKRKRARYTPAPTRSNSVSSWIDSIEAPSSENETDFSRGAGSEILVHSPETDAPGVASSETDHPRVASSEIDTTEAVSPETAFSQTTSSE
ncbi:major histocompatibility complex class I-related gene protein-like [Corythoichthys intestinalis]|uniref:major histocompatibility complex class I-related gene protein-like n=1 Tax=Corythoichthys intestinalis TaxID=161448 RepID=UPI0025A65780|nr:major histocompatibility complex class I-related gene protein-like [Corythoichthys intestinalis]